MIDQRELSSTIGEIKSRGCNLSQDAQQPYDRGLVDGLDLSPRI